LDVKEKYSIDIHDRRFSSKQNCIDFLVQARWKGKPQCPYCNNDNMNYYLAKRSIYKCSSCRMQFSPTKGTIFESSKIPLTKWFKAIYFFTTSKRGFSSYQMAKWIGVSQKTAWFLLHKIREAIKEENDIILKGIIEADETFVGPKINRDLRLRIAKKRYEAKQEAIHGISDNKKRKRLGPRKVGRKKGSTKKVLQQKKMEREVKGERTTFERCTVVFGMAEKKGRIVMKTLGTSSKTITKNNIYPLINNHVDINSSALITDELNVYTGVTFLPHLTVSHKKSYVTKYGVHINNIENAWNHFKRVIAGTYFHLSYPHFDTYLNENSFRWNRRNDSIKYQFDSFFPLVNNKKITYIEIASRKKNKLAA
jgi:transposase-like protein